MIIDASLVIDAVADPGPRGVAARDALAAQPAAEPLIAPGHFAFEVMSGLGAAANRPDHPLRGGDLQQALRDAESFEIEIEGIPWATCIAPGRSRKHHYGTPTQSTSPLRNDTTPR